MFAYLKTLIRLTFIKLFVSGDMLLSVNLIYVKASICENLSFLLEPSWV